MRRYLRLWYRLTINSVQRQLYSRFGAILFLLGKVLRFVFFLGFLVLLVGKTRVLSGYTVWQVVFFFLTYNFLDTLAQLLYRDVYRFRQKVVSGDLDLDLAKPTSVLFRSLTGGTDLLDFFMLVPYLGGIMFVATKLEEINVSNILTYMVLLGSGFLIATAFHIGVLALGVITTEIDHAIMIYRDLTQMGRVPVDIYNEVLRGIITFIIPVGIMMTWPAKALMGLLSLQGVLIAILFATIFFWLSLQLWKYSLTKYSSASS